jgi:ligand-binding SRPBCC domain-containing protein
MGFEIIDAVEGKIYPGQIIQYKVKPLFGIPLLWVTEITQVKENKFFIDEQRIGPYKFWHHKHFFKEVKDGIEMKDVIHYALPYGFLGRIVNKLFVRKQLQNIFKYRYQKINNIFNEQ